LEFSSLIYPVHDPAYAALSNTEIYGRISYNSDQPTPDPNHSWYSVGQFVIDLTAIPARGLIKADLWEVFHNRGRASITNPGTY
jgi:hypothetical protein